ncbi:MAG: winged helix-turn-helix transcriptional regulator [Thermoleophilia bacterium]|nr:winged helix-turn-helix transcriptional regulator [Thermoleophilia bacterium]
MPYPSQTPIPLYQAKAELFRTLGHPVRIRVLELLSESPRTVRELLEEIQIIPSSLSQQLAVLRRSGIVTSRREGAAVTYELAGERVAEMMLAARRVLRELLNDRIALKDALESEGPHGD